MIPLETMRLKLVISLLKIVKRVVSIGIKISNETNITTKIKVNITRK